ncbi:MAG TPA: hypothetical protein VMD92_10950 [Acidobacteriaceae bacterium]|nr:hypothetical protein [Acidobacteriaceae bacterium]
MALVSLTAAGAASAQTLAGVNTHLVKPLDSATAAQGQTVAVKLDGSVKTPDGVKLPRGTELVGKIAAVKPSQNGGPASLSVVFTTAQLKGGKQIPVKATLLAAYPDDQGVEAQYSDSTMDTVTDQVSADHQVDQEPGALPGVTLKAAVKDADSGTFTKADGNFKLGAGTFFQVGVGSAASGSGASAAE